MERKDFLKKMAFAGLAVASIPLVIESCNKDEEGECYTIAKRPVHSPQNRRQI